MYADTITKSMQRTIDETNRRREKQLKYNTDNGITPQQVIKSNRAILTGEKLKTQPYAYVESEEFDIAADPVVKYMSKEALDKAIAKAKKQMETAAKELDFVSAARYRDEMYALQKMKEKK